MSPTVVPATLGPPDCRCSTPGIPLSWETMIVKVNNGIEEAPKDITIHGEGTLLRGKLRGACLKGAGGQA